MKKIIFGAFALAFAFSAQAVVVSWTCSNLYAPDLSVLGETIGVEGTTWTRVFLYEDSEYAYYQWTAVLGETQIKSDATVALTISEGTSGVTPFSNTYYNSAFDKSGILGGMTTDDMPASTDGLFASIIVTYDDWTATTSVYFNTTGASGVAPLVLSGTWTKMEIVPIPEPATMALFGIGVMAFGLRRRRK